MKYNDQFSMSRMQKFTAYVVVILGGIAYIGQIETQSRGFENAERANKMIASSYADLRGARRAASREFLTAVDILRNEEGRFEIHNVADDCLPAPELDPTVMSPIAFMWAFIDANKATMTRREMIAALRAMGRFNPATINTQMSRYHTAQGDRAEWYKIDKARKASRAA